MADLLGGPLPVDGSDGLDDDSGDIHPLAVDATASPTIPIAAVYEKSQHLSSNMSSSVSASQFLGNRDTSSISLTSTTTTTTQAPAVSDGSGTDSDRHDMEDAENTSSSQHANVNGTVMEQLLRVQLAALRQENEALHAALSHSSASAASLDKELEKAENDRGEAEAKLQASADEGRKERDALKAMAIRLRILEAQHVKELKAVQFEKYSLEGNLSATQNQTIEMQKQLQAAIETGKDALSAAEKQEAALTAGLQKARAGEDKYHNKAAALAKTLDQLQQANMQLRKILHQRVQQLRKSENLRARVEGALHQSTQEITRLAKRTGSEPWFEAQVSELRAALQNATQDAKFSRESRDAEQALLEAAQRDRKSLKNKLASLNMTDTQRIQWLTAALDESKAQILREEGNLSKAQQVEAHLRSDLKDEEQREKATEGALQDSVNRSTVVKQYADTEVQRARKETEDAELAAGKAVTRAARAEDQLATVGKDLQAAEVERDDAKAAQKQELQNAQDLAAEVQRLRTSLADAKSRLAQSEQHAATLQAQFDSVGDLTVPKVSASRSGGSANGKKNKKQQHGTRDKMRISLSLIERPTTDLVSSTSSAEQENEGKDESPDRAAMMKGDADRLQALLS